MALPDVADTYKIDLKQLNQGEELHNIFYYRDTSILAPAPADVASDWWDAVKATWRAIPTTLSGYQFIEIYCEELFGLHRFFTFPIPLAEQAGTRVQAADQMPSYVAMYIELVVGTRATRPGGKRISGWTEFDVAGQLFVNSAFTLGQNLGTILDNTFVAAPPGATMQPVVVGYPTPPPASQPLRVQDITGFVVDQAVSHQVSRDPRRR